jgi:hypothetical protein
VLRERAGKPCWHLPRHLQHIWNGSPLTDKRVLVRCYHGLGDTIQFVRFAPLLKHLAREVILWAQPPLIPLLRTADGIDRILPLHDGAPDVEFDVDIEIMELPHALRITPDVLPARVPYFDVPPRTRHEQDELTVGVVWKSGDWDDSRSIPFARMQQLISQVERISWQVFQRGPALQEWKGQFGTVPRITDVLDEAAAMQALDLLISVDTMSAHLGGALGVRTWTLLPAQADWRWMEQCDETPWYPTMRLFRQQRAGDWKTVIERVAMELMQTRDAWHTAHSTNRVLRRTLSD